MALTAMVGATLAAAAWIAPSSAEPDPDLATPTTTTAVPATSSTTTTTAPATTTTAPCPAVAGQGYDTDGDGCVEAVSIDGERVTVGWTTWRAGRPGDLVVVGDWDCDGVATVASLRTGTGEVFVFDRWERALTVDATTRVDGATGLRAVDPDGDGCPGLVAERADGQSVTVETS